MKISICSPLHGQCGCSTVSLFVAHSLVLTQRINVCLTHADFGNNFLTEAVGVEPNRDMTRSLTHVAKLLSNNMLEPDELPDYAIKVFDGMDLYSSDKVSLEQGELLAFYEFILSKMSYYTHVVMDVDAGVKAEISKLMLMMSDVVIIPMSHNNVAIDGAKALGDSLSKEFARSRRGGRVRIFYLLNHYDQSVSKYTAVAKRLEIRPQRLLTLHENKELIRGTNAGKLSDIFGSALRGDVKTVNLRTDMRNLCKALLGKDAQWNVKKGANVKFYRAAG